MSALAGSSYVVLGGTGGIGAETCRRLRAGGARVAVAARDEARVQSLAEELDAFPVVLDARDADAVAAALDLADRRLDGLTGVVCCVGSLLLKPAHTTSAEEFRDVVDTNLGSAFATVRAAGRTLRRSGGSVVLVSTAAARTGLANHEAIAAAKAGVIGLALSAAATYAPRGIRVNVVAPGLVETPLTERITGTPAAREASERMHALGRLGTPGDVASAIVWLLDPANSWVTGQVLGVDGGLGSVRPR